MTPVFPVTCSSSTLKQWDDFSQFNKNRAEAEMKGAIELREAIALTIAEVTDRSTRSALPYLLFPVGHVASHPLTGAISSDGHELPPSPCPASFLSFRRTINSKPRGLQQNLPSGSGCGRWRKCTVSSSGKRRM